MKKIFHILLSWLLALMTVGMSAQEMTSLEKFHKTLNERYISFSCRYTLQPARGHSASSFGKVSGEAEVEMQGDAYIFNGNGLSIVSDGKSICIIDVSAKEAVYEAVPADLSEADFLQNPAYLIRGLEDNFKVSGQSEVTGASGADYYVLEPVVDCGINKCILYFKAGEEWLSKAVFELSDGNVLEVEVYDHNSLPKKPLSHFAPQNPSSFDSTWIITDLR